MSNQDMQTAPADEQTQDAVLAHHFALVEHMRQQIEMIKSTPEGVTHDVITFYEDALDAQRQFMASRGFHFPDATTGEALATFRAMPALVPVPTPVSPWLPRLWSAMADMEWITAAVEKSEMMPTPDEIKRLLNYAARMKVAAEAAGFEFEGDK